MKKGLLLIATAVVLGIDALLMLVALSPCRPSPRPPISRANFDRIQIGMKLSKVEALLGGSPGDYTTWPHMVGDGTGRFIWEFEWGSYIANTPLTFDMMWAGDEGTIYLRVCRGVVQQKKFENTPWLSEEFREQLTQATPRTWKRLCKCLSDKRPFMVK